MKKIMKCFTIVLVFIFMTFIPIKLLLPIGVNMQIAVAAEIYSAWDSTTIYNKGDMVSHDGSFWIAQWWTQGQTPGAIGQGIVWKMYKSNVIENVSSTRSEVSDAVGATKKSDTVKKLIAITFDDGPDETTTLVLNKLQKYNTVASFFLIGKNVNDTTKAVVQRELSMGCEINSHSWSHSHMNEMSSEDIANEMQKTSEAIYKVVGIYPKFFRPPYIETNNIMYNVIDIPFIDGIGCSDWDPSVSTEARVETVLNKAKDGDIILLHDSIGNTKTVDALDALIPGLRDKGFTFVTVSQLFEQKGVNSNIKYKLWSNVTN